VLLAELPRAKRLLGDKGYDADWLRAELKARGVRACIPARSGRNRPASQNRKHYKKHCRIENAFAPLKDWRGIAMRYTPCADLFLSAIALAAVVIFWLRRGVPTLRHLP
jgi:IS5 family transposase